MSSSSTQTKIRVAAISVFASAGMACAKFVVGVAIGSLALISEALHSAIDVIATIITWLVVRVSDRPADEEHHYGHGKVESLSALGVIALLYVLAGGVLVQAISHLRGGAPPPTVSAIAFIVLLTDIAVNLWRAWALHRTARATASQALAADALHFASDVLGSLAVIAGLALSAFGFVWGDSAAAIAVAVMIAILGLRLGRSTVETLIDRAPDGVAERAASVIRAIPGVIEVERLRARMVGPTHFIDAIVHVPRTFPLARIDAIKQQAQTALTTALDHADLAFTAIPVAHNNETVRERIMVIARNSALTIDRVTVHNVDDKLIVSINLEVDGEMPLNSAHELANQLEKDIATEFGDDIEIDVHIEPQEPEAIFGADAPATRVRAVEAALTRIVANHGIHDIYDIHDVRVRSTAGGEIVNFHCCAAPTTSIINVHTLVDEIEHELRRIFPSVKRVISHTEPPSA